MPFEERRMDLSSPPLIFPAQHLQKDARTLRFPRLPRILVASKTCECSDEKRESRLVTLSIHPHPASPNAIEPRDPMKIDARLRELLQSNKWSFSDNVRKSGKMESPGAWGQSLCNICQSFEENLVKFSSRD